jgi:hypothetical protein
MDKTKFTLEKDSCSLFFFNPTVPQPLGCGARYEATALFNKAKEICANKIQLASKKTGNEI